MKHTVPTSKVCARSIDFEIDHEGLVRNVKFNGGCLGNSQGISALVEGMTPAEVVKRLKGIQCRLGTSCPHQLAMALETFANS